MNIQTVFNQVILAQHRYNNSEAAPYLTNLELDPGLSQETGMNVFMKQEHMQRTGSFKYRGALNRILSLSDAEKQKGVVTASSGNHGMASALAASASNIPLTVYVPADASPLKVEKIKQYGAVVTQVEGDCLLAEQTARRRSEQEGMMYISPYNDLHVMAGQGTIGAELFQQLPNIDVVFVSVGGGGLISGIGSYIKCIAPHVDIVGCWPQNAPVMAKCLEAGSVIEVPESETLSDGTAGGLEPEAVTFEVCQQVIDKKVLVSESEIKQHMIRQLKESRMIVEGAAAVAIAGAVKMANHYKGKNAAVVLCGRNISFEKLTSLL